EFKNIEVADLGLGELNNTGLQILTLYSSSLIGIKLLISRPFQFFPQHRHPPSKDGAYPGKTEIFRGQQGTMCLYVPGEPPENPRVSPPEHRKQYCSIWHEVVLTPGEQYVSLPNTWHWFMAGSEGAVVFSFSTKAMDSEDQFLDPQVKRKTIIER
ncbi:MAG: D-lyxose/D-mannose family sugar isomerase, partial [Spirochaetes bacterium]|nr:D-lyxose/D-mannose family sugar isomerase [Spirochaetota bacterium]